MKNSFKFVAIASLLLSGASFAEAVTLPTNVVLSISIQLAGTAQGATSTSRSGATITLVDDQNIATKDVIKALGGKSGDQLLLTREIDYTTNTTSVTNRGKVTTTTNITGSTLSSSGRIVLRENGTDTLVTNLFTSKSSTNLSVTASTISSAGAFESETSYRIEEFTFESATLDFTVQGLEVVTLATHTSDRIVITDTSASITSLSGTFGTGTSGTETGVCTGTMTTRFQGFE